MDEKMLALVLILNEMPDPRLFYSAIVDGGYDFSVVADIVEQRRRTLRQELSLLQQELNATRPGAKGDGATVVPFPAKKDDQPS
ncbi:hypothetical protein [Dyella flagellata]|uniref:hypothetical protein n=1 Tax=Dyella flagellata TaxID=1867833 RepID=UPI00385022CC